MKEEIIKSIVEEIVTDIKRKDQLSLYEQLKGTEKENWIINQYLKDLIEKIDYEIEKTSHNKKISAIENLGFQEINLPNKLEDDKFSLMYCKDRELLCSIYEEKSGMTITCVSPYLDKTMKFDNIDTFKNSLNEGKLAISIANNNKRKIVTTELPLLSDREHARLDNKSFASYYRLTDKEEKQHNYMGVIIGVDFNKILEMERKYDATMQLRKIEREKLIEERLAILPESFKEYISYEPESQKTFK